MKFKCSQCGNRFQVKNRYLLHYFIRKLKMRNYLKPACRECFIELRKEEENEG